VEVTPQARTLATALGSIKVAFGLGAILAPGLTRKLVRLPAAHDNPSARVMGRLFGWRELALGAMVLAARDRPDDLHALAGINAAIDLGDAAGNAIPILKREGITAGAGGMLVTALIGAAAWDRLRHETA
jgi:uncharacterized protein YjeT (DUF2065 family)